MTTHDSLCFSISFQTVKPPVDRCFQTSQFILKVLPDILQFTEFMWQCGTLVAAVYLAPDGCCIKRMNGRWDGAHKEKINGTNRALMKISSLLINVETYTHHAHAEQNTLLEYIHPHKHG